MQNQDVLFYQHEYNRSKNSLIIIARRLNIVQKVLFWIQHIEFYCVLVNETTIFVIKNVIMLTYTIDRELYYKIQIAALYRDTFSAGPAAQFCDPLTIEQEILLTQREGFILIARENEQVVAALFAFPLKFDRLLPEQLAQRFDLNTTAYISEVMVDASCRGRGIGKQILQESLVLLKQYQFKNVILRVWEENTVALNLYYQENFEKVGEMQHEVESIDRKGLRVFRKHYLSKHLNEHTVMDLNHLVTRTIVLDQGNPVDKRAEIRAYFLKTWEIDEKLYTQLRTDDIFYHRGDPLRHILLFYLGHTAVFYINKFLLAGLIQERIAPALESIFAVGVDEMSWDDLNNNHYDWPSVEAVREYRRKAKDVILHVIDHTHLEIPIRWENPFWIVMMGIEHERIHLETSSVLIRQLPLEEVVAGRFGSICADRGEAPENTLVTIPAAKVILGKSPNHPLYGWDNEYGFHFEDVEDFETSRFLISNREFLSFIEAGGYQQETYWTEEGWNWCRYKNAEMPLFWRKDNDGYRLRLVAEEIPMPWNWPVEVNYLEAKAYCNWKTAATGKQFRLPTEAEWYRMLELAKLPDQPYWDKAPGNLNLEQYASPCPVDQFQQGPLFDVTGNVWQWTETPITGFPGFKVHPLYDDFSTPTFDGKHNLIKGGSWISTGNEATQHARYAFRRHFYQHAGFRVVQSHHELILLTDEYETDVEVANACENQWGNTVPTNFEQLLAQAIREHIAAFAKNHNSHLSSLSVLDLNTDTGRLAFEMAPWVKNITALDFSARFIRMPIFLQERGFMRYIVKDDADLVFYREVVLADTALGEGMERILFMQDNVNNLKPIYSGFDVIVAPGVLEDLVNPIDFLKEIHTRINPGGWLVIASTYDWELRGLPLEARPGGFKQDGEPVSSFDGIKAILSENFDQEGLPFNLMKYNRFSSRKMQQELLEVSFWRKK